jgi:transcription termination factor Rho
VSAPAVATGVLELHPKGFGFLRDAAKSFVPRTSDAYVPQPFIQRFGLKAGQLIGGPVEPPRKGATGPRLTGITTIEGVEARTFRRRPWDELTPVDPTRLMRLETGPEPLTTRVIDLFTPVGFGQRGLIVAPPRSGKTVLLTHVAHAVLQNHPQAKLMVLLVDERPEEVTEFRRGVTGAEVIASSNDQEVAVHVRTAELCVERAKRLVELGQDVVILLDSLTRLARAYNKFSGSGRTMSGGVDIKALDIPKRLFGSARAFDEGGSLTILGTALVETNSRMDDVIFQEFKGTGNMELVLDRKLAEKRVYPAIDLAQSGTRKEERLLSADTFEKATLVRRSLMQMGGRRDGGGEGMEALVKQLKKTDSNQEFLDTVSKVLAK